MMILERTIQATPGRRILWAVAAAMPVLLILLVVGELALTQPEVRAGLDVPTLRTLQGIGLSVVALQVTLVGWVWPRRDANRPMPRAACWRPSPSP